MLASHRSSLRRGAGASTVLTVIVALLGVAAVGFALGRMVSGGGGAVEPTATEPVAASEPTVREKTRPEPTSTTEDVATADRTQPFRFEPAVINFGFLKPQEIAEGKISIRNVSREPLKIVTVKAGCACTEVEDVAGQSIPAGQTLDVPFTLKGRNAGGERDVGVDFIFDGWGLATVQMLAQYTRAIRCEPGYLLCMQEEAGTVSLSAIDRRPFKVLLTNNRTPEFVDFDPASGETRSRYQLKWDVSEWSRETCLNANGDPFPGHWVIETDHPDAPVVELFLRHPCQQRVDVGERLWRPAVSSIVVGALKPGESFDFETSILALKKNIRISESFHAVLSESNAFSAELVGTTGSGLDAVCTIRVTAAADHRGLMMGTLRLYSSQFSAPIKIIGTVRDW